MITFSKIQKTFFFLFCNLIIYFYGYTQVVITSSDLPVPGDKMVFGVLPQPGNAVQGYTSAGAGMTWNFSGVNAAFLDTNRHISSFSSEIQFLCIATFNNPFDTAHQATVVRPGQNMQVPMGTIQVTDVFEFFRKTGNAFSLVGRSTSVNGVPTCIRNNPVDRIYKFPFAYQDTLQSFSAFDIQIPGVGYYGQTLSRQSQADAWGTVITPSGTFQVLRIKSVLQFTDSVFYESMGIGLKFPHTETHYTWLSNDLKFPVFVIEERGLANGGTIALWADTSHFAGIRETENRYHMTVFPNPAQSSITVSFSNDIFYDEVIILTDLTGKIVFTEQVKSPIHTILIENISPGLYILKSLISGDAVKIAVY